MPGSSFRNLSLALLIAGALLATPAAAAEPAPQPVFAIVFRPGPAWKPGLPMVKQDLRPHAAYYARLESEGRVVAAGGWVGVDGGMALVRAGDIEEARRILAADPAITSRVFEADLREWKPRFGADPMLLPPKPKP